MKLKFKITIALIALFLAPGMINAEDAQPRKSRITIYNFGMVKTPPEDVEKEIKTRNFSYYSFILPETISKQLQKSEKIAVTRNKGELPGGVENITTIDRDSLIKILSSEAEKTSSDYIVAGRYQIKDKTLNVKIYFYNAAAGELHEAGASGEETGLYLKDTTDALSQDIEQKIKDIVVSEIEEKIFYPFYYLAKPFTFVSLGLNSGYIWFSGEWERAFNNAVYYNPYISFDITRFFDLTLKFDYFYTDSEGKDITPFTMVSVVGGSVLIGLKYPVFNNFDIYLSAGGGMAHSRFDFQPDGPFEASLGSDETNDPCAEGEFGFKIAISPFYIKTGAVYKRIFYEKEPVDLGIVFAGAGIHF